MQGWPIITIYYQITGSHVGTTMLMFITLFTVLVGDFGILASASRLVWAFSRDNGLPFSRFFSYVSMSHVAYPDLAHTTQVSPTYRIPLRALFLVVLIVMCLSLIPIGLSTAFNAILSLSTLGLYTSYVVPITFMAIKRARGQHVLYGPFKLGRFGLATNIFAVIYGLYAIVFLPFPPGIPVTAESMDYSGPILGLVILIALLDWSLNGRKRWAGPGRGRELAYVED